MARLYWTCEPKHYFLSYRCLAIVIQLVGWSRLWRERASAVLESLIFLTRSTNTSAHLIGGLPRGREQSLGTHSTVLLVHLTRRTVEWVPRDCSRPRGRPPIRWADVFVDRVKKMRFSRTAGARSRHNRLQPTSWWRLRDNDTNGSRVGARTYSEDEPSKHLRK